MTSKKALERIKREVGTPYFSTLYDIDMWREDFKTVEKDLELLELIKEKAVNVARLNYAIHKEEEGLEYYNSFAIIEGFDELTKEEYKLLKEWLENGKIN